MSALRYEVMYLLDAEDATIPAFKSAWASLGDSIVVVGGDGLWNCHVHTDDIGGAVEAGIEAGRPRNIRVTDLLEQVEEEGWVAEAAAIAPIVHAPEDMVETAVVAIAVGDGVRRLLASLGVQEIVAGGQSMNPSTAQILEAVERCPSDSVIVLPNNKNIVAGRAPGRRAHEQVGRGRPHPLGGRGARRAARLRPGRRARDQHAPSSRPSVARVTAGEVTQSVRDTVAECGPIRKGDWIAIGPRRHLRRDRLGRSRPRSRSSTRWSTDDSEIVTVLVGRRRPRGGDRSGSASTSRSRTRGVEVEVHDGGQPLYPYLIGVE